MVNDNTNSTQNDDALAGEDQGIAQTFTADEVAKAFGVEVDRVHRAISGEFGRDDTDGIDSQEAQHLAEVLLGDLPLAEQEAALMTLGAYTPRFDAGEATVAEKPEGELSDRLRPTEEVPEITAPPDE